MVDDPGPGDVVVRVEAAPINPTDTGLIDIRTSLLDLVRERLHLTGTKNLELIVGERTER